MFELIQAAGNTYYFNCPAKIGVYCLPNNKVILIDSGNDKEAGRKILKILNEKNWELEAIISTHSNADHIGGNKFLSDRTGCKVYAKGIEKAFCEYPILEPSILFGAYPNKHLRHKFLMAEPCQVNDIENFTLPSGMEVFSLKGHFFDMIGVKTPDKVSFLADSIFSEAVLKKYPMAFVYDIAEFIKTLDFIETLDAEMFIPAHTDTLRDIKPLVDINRKMVFEIINCIKNICKKPSHFEAILKEIFDKYDMELNFSQYALAGSTVRSYLSYLLDNNILAAEFQNNYLLWKLI